ncbi:MAG: hypothetical protein WDW36_000013 [Sanguina aurantia]
MSQQQLANFYQLSSDPDAAAWFARDAGFGPVRTACLLNITQDLMLLVVGGCSFEVAQMSLQAALLGRTRPRPAADSDQLSVEQVAAISQHLAGTLFRHFKLYTCVFSTPQGHTKFTVTPLVETAVIQPFDKALTEEEWQAFHRGREAEREAAVRAEEEQAAAEQAAAAAAAAEAERLAAETRRKEELAKKPATLEEAISHMVTVKLEHEKRVLAGEYRAREEALLVKISALQAAAPPGVPPPVVKAK